MAAPPSRTGRTTRVQQGSRRRGARRRPAWWLATLSGVLAAGLVACSPADPGADDPTSPPDTDSEVGESTSTPAPEATDAPTEPEDAELSEACGRTFAFPDDPVPGDVFAQCAATSMLAAASHRLVSTDADLTWDRTVHLRPDYRLDAVNNEGTAIRAVGDVGWVSLPGAGWVQVYPEAPLELEHLSAVVGMNIEAHKETFHEAYWSTSPEYVPTGTSRIDDVGVWGFTGTPDGMGAEVLRYEIWIDSAYLPVRIESVVSLMGYTSEVTYEFSAWGEAVEVEIPTEG